MIIPRVCSKHVFLGYEEEMAVFKRNLSKKHCRHMAFLTAFVLAFTNVGSCMTVSFAEEIVGGEAGGSGAGDVGGSGTGILSPEISREKGLFLP